MRSIQACKLPEFVTAPAARALLPAQKAVVEAVAGGDRFERTFHRADEPPLAPVCVRCGEGSLDTPSASSSDWCDRFGHTAFGVGSETRWETAQDRYQWQLRRWERSERPARSFQRKTNAKQLI